ncbi:MAG: hypothetical protein QM768_17220 [Agriterribacter sp.]
MDKHLVWIYFVADVVVNAAWIYSTTPLPRRCMEREKEGEVVADVVVI